MRTFPEQVYEDDRHNDDDNNYDVSRLSLRVHRNIRCDETSGSYTLYQFDSRGGGREGERALWRISCSTENYYNNNETGGITS